MLCLPSPEIKSGALVVSDAFECVEQYVRRVCGEEALCVHAGNTRDCEIKRHPSYTTFRSAATESLRNPKRSRLWESMVALGRAYDLRGDDKWRMIIMDCLTPSLRWHAYQVAQKLYVDVSDVRSDMVEAALTAWVETANNVPPHKVPQIMKKAAIRAAYERATALSRETSTDEPEEFVLFEESPVLPDLRAASIIHHADPRDPDVAEQIRGERYGALLQKHGCINAATNFHQELRSGGRPAVTHRAAKAPMLARSRLLGPSHYYYISDFYPPFIGIQAAAEVLGIPESTAYRMVRNGSFPCPPTRMGRSLRVPVPPLMHFAHIPDVIVHPDDVENGAAHASGLARGNHDRPSG